MRPLVALAACLTGAAIAAQTAAIAPFSAMTPGELQKPWRAIVLPTIKAARFSLVKDGGVTVLGIRAEEAAGTVGLSFNAEAGTLPMLSWRWKVDRVVEKADMTTKAGDDYAARVYVFFDVPLHDVPFVARMKILLARALYGEELPTAALCYVWDNRQPVGTSMPNAYTDRVHMIVLESGAARVSQWVNETRDVEADFRKAFESPPGPVPRITGIGASADTDQTGESVTAWFGDFRLEARP